MQKASSAQWTVGQICEWLGVPIPDTLVTKAEQAVQYFTSIATNPRPSGLHFAVGANPRLIDRLKKAKTIAVVDTEPRFDSSGNPFPTIICPSPLELYVQLLQQIRLETNAWVVAVTGSDGKTVTKEMLRLVLQTTFSTHWNRGTGNVFGQIGINIQNMPSDTEVYVQEVGASTPGRIEAASEMLSPHAVVYTNIGMAHSDNFGSPEEILKEKLQLDEGLPDDGVVFVNFDDSVLKATTFRHTTITYGVDDPHSDFTAIDVTVTGDKQTFTVLERSTGEQTPVVLRVLGKHNISNALAAFAVGRWLGVSPVDAAQGIGRFRPTGTRQNLVALGGHKVLVDCFSASAASVMGMAQSLESIPVPPDARHLMVLGDIPSLGHFSESVHRELGSKLASVHGIDAIYCIGDDTKWLAAEAMRAGKSALHFENKELLERELLSSLRQYDAIGFKAGGPTALETVIDKTFGTEFMLTNLGQLSRKAVKAEGMRFSLTKDYGAELTSLATLDDNIRLRFGDSVEDYPLVRIGKGACKDSSLVEVILYNPILSVGSSAFQGSTDLHYVEFPSTLRLIDVNAFQGCVSLEEVFLPDGVQTLRRGAFRGCKSLRSIVIPRSVRTIDRGAFSECERLQVHCYPDAPSTAVLRKFLPEHQISMID